jgi:hypothetical protein
MNMATGILFFTIGNVLAWFQYNSQFVWPWWRDKPVITNLIFAIPMGLCFWYAVRQVVNTTGLLWTSKLVGFGVSNVIFAILTYFFMKESMLTPKTMICLVLSMAIIGIQIFWK